MVMDSKKVDSIVKSVTDRLGKTSQKSESSIKKPFQIKDAAKKVASK